MDKLLLHPKTLGAVERLLISSPHGVLITGPAGSGKQTLAVHLAAELLDVDKKKLETSAYFKLINPEGNSISIDDIRELQQFLKLKVPGAQDSQMNRVVLILVAERMGHEAQNALLKTLEEPPAGTCLILTTESKDAVLPTISSRTIELPVMPVGREAAADYFKNTKMDRHYALSQGQVGLLSSLIHNESHPLIASVETAKIILSESIGKRLLRTDELAKDKSGIQQLISALERICHAAIHVAASKNQPVTDWHRRQKAVLNSLKLAKTSASPKLILDNLFLNL